MIEPLLTCLVVVIAVMLYVVKFIQIKERKWKKHILKKYYADIDAYVMGEATFPKDTLPKDLYYFVVDKDGKIKEHSLHKESIGLQLDQNIYMAPAYKKFVSRGEMGGGYTTFKWQTSQEGRLGSHLAYSKKRIDGTLLCICSEE